MEPGKLYKDQHHPRPPAHVVAVVQMDATLHVKVLVKMVVKTTVRPHVKTHV